MKVTELMHRGFNARIQITLQYLDPGLLRDDDG